MISVLNKIVINHYSPCNNITMANKPKQISFKSNRDVFIKTTNPQNEGLVFVLNDLKNSIKNVHVFKLNITVQNDKLKIKNEPKLETSLNNFIKIAPEFINVFKITHNDAEGLDKHTLRTFKKLLKNKEYNELSQKDKIIMELAALLHDTGKTIIKGPLHPKASAEVSKRLLKPINIDNKDKNLIVKLVRHHYWAGNIQKDPTLMNEYAKRFDEREISLLKLLTVIDITSRKKTNKQYLRNLRKVYPLQLQMVKDYQAN